jgi:hypothetical protein
MFRRWPRIACIVGALLLAGAGVAYLLIVHAIRSQLESLVSTSVDAQLQEASVSWLPPYGIVVRDARIIRGDGRGGSIELFHADRIEAKLGGIPHSGKPVIIESLLVRGPSVHLLSTEQQAGPPPGVIGSSNSPAPPTKWSDQVQVGQVHIEGGSLFYQDRNDPGVPDLAVKNINLTAGPPASPGAAHQFDVTARDGSTHLHATGSIQPDEMLIGIDDIALDVRLDPAASQSALPQPLSDWAKRFGIAGALALHGKGRLPCQSPQLSTFDGTVEVSNASAAWPELPWPIEKAHVKLECDTEPAPATQPAGTNPVPPGLHVRLAAGDAFFGGVGLHLDSGDFREDHAAGAWKLTQLAGHVAGVAEATSQPASALVFHQSSTDGSQRSPTGLQPARGDMPRLGVSRQTKSDGSQASPTTNPADEPPLRGRIDFTGTASGPIPGPDRRPAANDLHYELLAFPRDLALKIKSFPLPIEHIDGGQIRVVNGAVSLRDMAGDYGGDRIILNSARIPIPDQTSELWQLETRIEEITGTVTCYQPGPVYPEGIQSTLAELRPEGTFAIGNGRLTLNYRLPQSGKPKPADDFAFDISSDGSAAFSVTKRRIPITNVRGKATVDNLAIIVGTDGLKPSIIQGRCMEGDVSLHMKIIPRSGRAPAHFQGEAWVRDINVALLCNVFDLRDGEVSRAGGKGYLHTNFSLDGSGGKTPPSETLRADGEAEILGADYWEDPIVRLVAGDVQTRSPAGKAIKKEQGVCDAAAVFHIANRVITLERAAVNSPSLGIQATGTITFDKLLDLKVIATPIGNLKAAIDKAPIIGPVAGDIVGLVQGALRTATGTLLYQYRITGPATHPQKQFIAAPVLSDAGALLFGRMAQQKKGELLKNVRAGTISRQTTPATAPAVLPGKSRDK